MPWGDPIPYLLEAIHNRASSGDVGFIPKDFAHNHDFGEHGGRVLVHAPSGLEKFFAVVAHALSVGPITWELEQEIAKRYGQEFLDHLAHWR